MKPKVLFLCTGNSARSQMAEGWLRHLGGDQFEVFSAGIKSVSVNPLAVAAMREEGVDISGHASKSLERFLGSHFGYLITVCDNARESCPVFPGVSQRLHWSFEDPTAGQGTEEERLERFREVRDQIRARIEDFVGNSK